MPQTSFSKKGPYLDFTWNLSLFLTFHQSLSSPSPYKLTSWMQASNSQSCICHCKLKHHLPPLTPVSQKSLTVISLAKAIPKKSTKNLFWKSTPLPTYLNKLSPQTISDLDEGSNTESSLPFWCLSTNPFQKPLSPHARTIRHPQSISPNLP